MSTGTFATVWKYYCNEHAKYVFKLYNYYIFNTYYIYKEKKILYYFPNNLQKGDVSYCT